jgi:EEF1A lysine methyltransferase 4
MTDSDDSDSEAGTIDWNRLSSNLSPDVFAALQNHLVGEKEEHSVNAAIDCATTIDDVKVADAAKPAVNNAVFKEQGYWEDRFTEETEYDWLLSYEQLRTHLIPLLKVSDRILIVGCGNSRLSAGLYDAGFVDIVNIDFSATVIERMKKTHIEDRPQMQWITMDMTDMRFEAGAFDVVIDKASMDALMVDEGDVWDPEQETIDITDKMCKGIKEVLVPQTGKFIQLSFAQPHFRTKYLMGSHIEEGSDIEAVISKYGSSTGHCKRYGWNLSYSIINTEAGCLNSFLYVMTL